MYATTYAKAKDVANAVSQLKGADEGKLLAGGQTLIPTLKQRLASSDCLIDLGDAGLSGISDEGGSIRIGAMTRHVEVCLLYTSPSPRDDELSRMPSSA